MFFADFHRYPADAAGFPGNFTHSTYSLPLPITRPLVGPSMALCAKRQIGPHL